MLRIVALVALILALFAASGCASGTGGTAADQTTTEVARWRESLTFWQGRVDFIANQLENPPPGTKLLDDKTRKSLVDALATARWYVDLFVGLTNNASTQPVPLVAPAK